ncbi:MAG: hypothetical protein QOK19_292 [Solirubrobacteraceae bacterium]|jgi:hypothetical protein|nr:hypothetical protein [Solirubrobacterales bacterium]MEA2214731.1 hypothetical protein [Solirubrobacteraceae bacterium]
MAYMIHHFWPGATRSQYEATVAVVHPPEGLPAGQTHHVAAQADGGILITAVWESQEQSELFVRDVLMASMPIEGGFEGRPDEQAGEIISSHSS